MLPLYRSAGPSTWPRQLRLRGVWLLKSANSYFNLRNVASTLIAFVVALALLPSVGLLALVLYLLRRFTAFLLGRFYPCEVIVKTRSVRGALDTPRSPGVCNVLLSVDGPVEVSELRSRVSACMSSAPPSARHRLKSRLGWYLWRPDPAFNVANHVHLYRDMRHIRGVNDYTIQDVVSTLCSRQFPTDRSPWEVILILLPSSNSSAILLRVHHLLAEEWPLKHLVGPTSMDIWKGSKDMPLLNGCAVPRELAVRIVHVVRSQWDELKQKCDPYAPVVTDKKEKPKLLWTSVRLGVYGMQRLMEEAHKLYELTDAQSEGRSTLGRSLNLLFMIPNLLRLVSFRLTGIEYRFTGVKKLLNWLVAIPVVFIVIAVEVILMLGSTVRTVVYTAKSFGHNDNPNTILLQSAVRDIVWGIIAAIQFPALLIRRIFRTLDPVPLLQGRVWSNRRVLAWADQVPRQLLFNIASTANASESDVLIAACAGVLRHYFRTVGTDVPEWVSATVPLTIESKDPKEKHVQGFTILNLPTGESNSRRRLHIIRDMTTKIRSRPVRFALSVFLLNQAVNLLPQPILTLLLNFLSYKHPVTVSQIKLPTVDPTLMPHGRTVSQIRYWRPGQGNIGLSFTLLSYSDHVALAVASDREVLPQPTVITNQFSREIHDMALAFGLHLDRQTLQSPKTIQRRLQHSS